MNRSPQILSLASILLIAAGYSSAQRASDTELCSQSPATGNCRGSHTRWYYNSAEGECKTFTWGGCGGNANRFGTKAACERKCKTGSQGCPERRCRMHCENGFITDASGCQVCACNPSPNSAICPEIECPVRCAQYEVDRAGCMTCECKKPRAPAPPARPKTLGKRPASSSVTRSSNSTDNKECPPVCQMLCPFGNKQDENGCDICACYTKEEVCGARKCRKNCPNGFVIDKRGCEICECRPVKQSVARCSKVRCRMECAYGFEKDEFGCERCVCASRQSAQKVDCSSRPSCHKYCPHGFVKGSDGCDTCRCANARKRGSSSSKGSNVNAPCASIPTCTMFCADGYERDEKGCMTCKCRTPGQPSQLPADNKDHEAVQLPVFPEKPANCDKRPMCLMFCEHGFQKGPDGCDTCKCKDAPSAPNCGLRPMCAMHCELGFKKDSKGCPTCACNAPPNAQAVDCSNKPLCRKHCEHGFKKGDDGCFTCECKTASCGLRPTCMMHCEQGYKTDENGCDKCECKEAPGVVDCSLRPTCRMYCQHGYVKGPDGCDSCKCKDAPVPCADRAMCRMFCEHGFKKDEDGCDKCECEVETLDAKQLPEGLELPAAANMPPPPPPPPSLGQASALHCDDLPRCRKHCEHGYQVGVDGCRLCQCNPPPGDLFACPAAMCRMYCPDGYVRDSNGCQTCRCL